MIYERMIREVLGCVERALDDSTYTLGKLAEEVGYSQWYLTRLFHVFSGYMLSDYIRIRRISEAARSLVGSEERILEIAIGHGFSSQESFSRSFKQLVGLTPNRYRRQGKDTYYVAPLDVRKLVCIQGGNEMKPELKKLPARTIVGMVYEGKNENQEIGQMWQVFNGRTAEIKHIKEGADAYGACAPMTEDLDISKVQDFRYMAGIEVDSAEDLPEGMETWTLDHVDYAVFKHVGDVTLIGETYKKIYGEWFPESGYEVAHTYDYELYTEDFKPGFPDSVTYIYVPINR